LIERWRRKSQVEDGMLKFAEKKFEKTVDTAIFVQQNDKEAKALNTS
jgi:hypothetical protein